MKHQNAQENAKRAIMAMPAITRTQHNFAWQRIEQHIHDTAKEGDKVFEIHHRVQAARERYFAAIVDGYSPCSCEELVMESLTKAETGK